VEKLMTSFRGFETELGDVGDKINNVAKKSTEAGKKLQNAFGKLGFKDSAKVMNEVVKATDKEAKLGEIVEAELKNRAEAVKNLKAQYEAAARAAEEASSKASGNSLSS
jgi:methyl-accepting chemotaxis protein